MIRAYAFRVDTLREDTLRVEVYRVEIYRVEIYRVEIYRVENFRVDDVNPVRRVPHIHFSVLRRGSQEGIDRHHAIEHTADGVPTSIRTSVRGRPPSPGGAGHLDTSDAARRPDLRAASGIQTMAPPSSPVRPRTWSRPR